MVKELCVDPWNPKYKFKRRPHFDEYFKGKILTVKKRGCKLKTEKIDNSMYCDFWWDIDNDWMLIPEIHTEKIQQGLDALKERNFDK